MSNIQQYYKKFMSSHYNNYRGMCTQMGVSLSELHTDELEDEDAY